jgi:hypothetical protein
MLAIRYGDGLHFSPVIPFNAVLRDQVPSSLDRDGRVDALLHLSFFIAHALHNNFAQVLDPPTLTSTSLHSRISTNAQTTYSPGSNPSHHISDSTHTVRPGQASGSGWTGGWTGAGTMRTKTKQVREPSRA